MWGSGILFSMPRQPILLKWKTKASKAQAQRKRKNVSTEKKAGASKEIPLGQTP